VWRLMNDAVDGGRRRGVGLWHGGDYFVFRCFEPGVDALSADQ
jgi:hypothetical protein